jgi:predicted nucleic acid-binding protein
LAELLLDTNVLVYAYDRTDGAKRGQAIELLPRVQPVACLSTQVLGEFFVTVTRRIPSPLSAEQAEISVSNYVQSWTVYEVNPFVTLEAIRGVRQHRLPFYDALIWAVAKLNQVPLILTEDGQHDRVIEGVRYANPFHPQFDVAALGV